ncbi:hypothetical protein Tco_1329590 [Tanacetum coccineum]
MKNIFKNIASKHHRGRSSGNSYRRRLTNGIASLYHLEFVKHTNRSDWLKENEDSEGYCPVNGGMGNGEVIVKV